MAQLSATNSEFMALIHSEINRIVAEVIIDKGSFTRRAFDALGVAEVCDAENRKFSISAAMQPSPAPAHVKCTACESSLKGINI